MRLIIGMLFCAFAWSTDAATDTKCYVELFNRMRLIMQTPVQEGVDPVEVFKKRGVEIAGSISMVKEVMECRPLDEPFSSLQARQQEETQLR